MNADNENSDKFVFLNIYCEIITTHWAKIPSIILKKIFFYFIFKPYLSAVLIGTVLALIKKVLNE